MKKGNKKNKKTIDKKVYIFIGVIMIGIIFMFIFIYINNKDNIKEPNNHSNSPSVINNKVDIDVGGYNQAVNLKEVLKDVTIDDDKYMKLYLEIENKKNVDSITSLHQFKLVNENNEDIIPCYHEGVLPNNQFDDILPKKITASEVTSGYLYCPTESSNVSKLKITVISSGTINENNEITYEYKDYYIDLK